MAEAPIYVPFEFPAPVPLVYADTVQESFDQHLHPKDRLGRWAHTYGRDALDSDPDPFEAAFAKLLRLAHPNVKPLPPIPLSAEVQKIKTRADAEAFIRSKGVGDVNLKGIEQTKSLREIAQATSDAIGKFPSLSGGDQGKLAGVVTMGSLDPHSPVFTSDVSANMTARDPMGHPETWAVTGPSPYTSNMNLAAYSSSDGSPSPLAQEFIDRAKSGQDEGRLPTGVGKGGADTWVVINDAAEKDPKELMDGAMNGGLAVTNSTTYGRMMHELGHAVASTDGISVSKEGMLTPVTFSGLTPADAAGVSGYAASNPDEFWGELFAVVNTPGVSLDRYSQKVQDGIHHLQQLYSKGDRRIL